MRSLASLVFLPKSNLLSRNLLRCLFSRPLHDPVPISSFPLPPTRAFTSHFFPLPNLHPCRYLQTLPSTPPLPFHLPETAPQSNPEASIESAATEEEILTALETVESSLAGDDRRLGNACLAAGDALDRLGCKDLEKALSFALRALAIFEKLDGGHSVLIVKALRLVGSISYKMKRLDDSLGSLNTAAQILATLAMGGRSNSEICWLGIAVYDHLARTKTRMGRRWEAIADLRRSLELKVAILEPNSKELGTAYEELAEACTVVLDFQEALLLCLKALDVYKVLFGLNSLEVARVRQLLGLIYSGLGKNADAFEQNELARKVMEDLGLVQELIQADIDAANIQISLDRIDGAINTLARAIPQADKDSVSRALALVSMAKALCYQERFGELRRCLETACGILENKESSCPAQVAEAYAEISMLYETMNEFETSLSLMKRTLLILEKDVEMQHLEGSISARIGWLLVFTKRVPEAVPYLESAIEKLKNCFGPKHFGLGFAYKHLGQAYLEMDQPQAAIKFLSLARDIIKAIFGKEHEDSIDTNQCLANAYGVMGSYSLAMDYQQQVLDAWQMRGPSATEELREAHRLVEQLKRKAQASPSAVFPANALPLPPPR